MPKAKTVTTDDLNHAVRKVQDIAAAVKKAREKKTLSQNDVDLILSCAPSSPGRPRGEKEYYDSMQQCAAKTGISLDLLKAAKRAGCPAFRGPRVYMEELREWLESNPVDQIKLLNPIDSEKLRELTVRRKQREYEFQVQQGLYVLKSDVVESNVHSIATAKSVMEGKRTALAMVIAAATGADPNFISAKIEERDREVCTELTKRENYTGATCRECGKPFRL
jgi:hypothetical protein